jgi:hypothetical protein
VAVSTGKIKGLPLAEERRVSGNDALLLSGKDREHPVRKPKVRNARGLPKGTKVSGQTRLRGGVVGDPASIETGIVDQDG